MRAQSKDISIRTSYASDVPELLKTDGRRLQQILYNLFGNAIKFSNMGSNIDFNILFDIKGQFLTLTATDLELEMVANAQVNNLGEDGKLTIPAKKLLDICYNAAHKYDFKTNNNSFHKQSRKFSMLYHSIL